jgi:UDPglucose--hexose-1-phosphate uridylyltransferase
MKKAEIRKDYLSNRYVIIAPGRNKRPHQFSQQVLETHKDSPFTADKIKKEVILDSIGRGAKRIIAIPNRFPAVTPNNPKAYGFQEVIVETPSPNVRLADLGFKQVKDLFRMYQKRTKFLLKKPRLNYLICFKNEGLDAGASISHAHSQIFATEIVPLRIVETKDRLSEYKIEHGHSFYKDIIIKEMKSARRIFEDKSLAVFCPYASAYENEVWIVTKREMSDITKLNDAELSSFARSLSRLLQPLKKMNAPYNYFFHAVKGSAPEHLCLRIQPRAHIWSGVELDSSMTVNWVVPEEAAKMYRKAFKNN